MKWPLLISTSIFLAMAVILPKASIAQTATGGTTYAKYCHKDNPGGPTPTPSPSPGGGGGTATPYAWTDPGLTAGQTPVKAIHITDLRSAINAKQTACSLPTTTWLEAVTAGVTPIKKQHVDELRTAVNDLMTKVAASKSLTATLPTYTDPTLVVNKTPVRAAHIQELRAAVDAVVCGAPGPGPTLPLSFGTFNGIKNIAAGTFNTALWNNYKAWLIAQFAAMGSDISGMDFSAQGTQFGNVAKKCKNFGDDNPGPVVTYVINGMKVNLRISWAGLEYTNGKGGCMVMIQPSLVGSLNGFTCP
jgi:hypothetical protein